MSIRSVSDFRIKHLDVECEACELGSMPHARDGHYPIAARSLDQYGCLNGSVETALDAADCQAKTMKLRYSHEEVFSSIRGGLRRG